MFRLSLAPFSFLAKIMAQAFWWTDSSFRKSDFSPPLPCLPQFIQRDSPAPIRKISRMAPRPLPFRTPTPPPAMRFGPIFYLRHSSMKSSGLRRQLLSFDLRARAASPFLSRLLAFPLLNRFSRVGQVLFKPLSFLAPDNPEMNFLSCLELGVPFEAHLFSIVSSSSWDELALSSAGLPAPTRQSRIKNAL